MKFLSAKEIKSRYIDNNNFMMLLEKEANIRDSNRNTTLMYIC